MRHLTSGFILISLSLVMAGFMPAQSMAWVGLELDAKATGISDPYGATGSESSGSLWELSARGMYQGSFGSLETELHGLGHVSSVSGDTRLSLYSGDSSFRTLDLEAVHRRSDRTLVYSEIDRLLLSWRGSGIALTLGRQAITWGEAFFYNIGDLFGAFPVTETNRRYKTGIDAVNVEVRLGPFSNLSLAQVPVEDAPDSLAAHLTAPLGPGTFSLSGGRVLEDGKAGAGYTVDISGTQVYGSFLLTNTSDGNDYTQAVAGAERQVGPHTLVMGEIYRNGWSTGDPDDYPSLLLSDNFRSGNVLTLGRYSAALTVSRQVSPLLTLTPALFANLSDGSCLIRMDGSYSVSDYTGMTGGLFIGIGERPDNGIWRSEYGGIPVSVYIEIVHNI